MVARGAWLTDDLPVVDWVRRRDAMAAGERTPDAPMRLSDELSVVDWMAVRNRPTRGDAMAMAYQTEVDPVIVRGRSVAAQPKPQPKPSPLKGRPGAAALVAGALNAITAGPNTTGTAEIENWGKGTIRRGPAADVHVNGRVGGIGFGADGTLDPASGKPEVSFSDVKGRGLVKLPPRIRVFTTPTGELDFELSGPIKLAPKDVLGKGTYVIGTPDPPKPKPRR